MNLSFNVGRGTVNRPVTDRVSKPHPAQGAVSRAQRCVSRGQGTPEPRLAPGWVVVVQPASTGFSGARSAARFLGVQRGSQGPGQRLRALRSPASLPPTPCTPAPDPPSRSPRRLGANTFGQARPNRPARGRRSLHCRETSRSPAQDASSGSRASHARWRSGRSPRGSLLAVWKGPSPQAPGPILLDSSATDKWCLGRRPQWPGWSFPHSRFLGPLALGRLSHGSPTSGRV